MRIVDFSVKWRLMVAVIIPLAAVLVLASMHVANSWSNFRQAQHLVEMGEGLGVIGDLVHALQVERGTTAGFLGSSGKVGREAMLKARTASDGHLAGLERVLKDMADSQPTLAQNVDAADKALADLITRRDAIDKLSVAGRQSFVEYSEAINQLLSLSRDFSLQTTASGLTNQIVAYNLLLRTKEVAGQERGMANGFINAGYPDPDRYMEFVFMGGAQSALLREFMAMQEPPTRTRFSEMLKANGAEAVETLRAQILASGVTTDLSGLVPGEWFKVATVRIENMKVVEDAALAGLMERAGAIADTEFGRLTTIAILSAVGILVTIGFSGSLSYTVVRPLGRLRQAMEKLARGEIEVNLIQSEGKDEIASMGHAVRSYIKMSRERAEREREEEARLQAIKLADTQKLNAEREARQAELNFAVEQLSEGLVSLSSGIVSHRLQQPFAPVLDSLRLTFNASVEKIETALSAISASTQGIHNGAFELQRAADDLAQRTERQATALEQASAAVSEITQAIGLSSRRAEDAGRLVGQADRDAHRSGEVVRNTVAAMERIAQSSTEISKIIGVIDEIAFQTNLLALNAGVEAARAGEAGKGFAVVAQEVRELAQRSAGAAREIKALIVRSSREVEVGVTLVDETGEALKSIETHVRQISEEVAGIIVSAREQSASLAEISAVMGQMDQVTQQNAAMAEETTAATHGLAEDSERLAGSVGVFTLTDAPLARAA